jgi:hemerythrin-like domain-containing protein
MTAILLLRLEHHRFDDLLNLIEEQLDEDAAFDRELLRNLVDYFAGYPVQCHHPVEDIVFRKLRARSTERAATVGEILKEHKDTAELTKRFGELLEAVADEEDDLPQELRDVMRRFVDNYRAHMIAEEKNFFSVALDTLSEDDWREVEFALFDKRDPLFDRQVEERFSRLRDKIDDLAKRSYRRGAFLRESKQLHQLNSINAFNEAMGRESRDYRILEHVEGGYGLEHAGKFVIDIPKCSPNRAAWCAWFYVEAATRREP